MNLIADNPLQLWCRGRIPRVSTDRAYRYQWYSSDSYEQYVTNGNKEFGTDDIWYEFNSDGYRCKEFSEIDHDAFKILTTGCSETFGVGIPSHLTFIEQLGSLIRQRFGVTVEVINMGVGGRSIDYITRLLFQSVPILQPNYVFCLMPDMLRRDYIMTTKSIATEPFVTLGSRTAGSFFDRPHDAALLTLSSDAWDFCSMAKNLAMLELILRDTCWSWDTWMSGIWKLCGYEAYFDLSHYRHQLFRNRGNARDNKHSGVPYHTAIANDLITDHNLMMALNRYR